ncbi:hypothetical protein OG230_35855 [Streptomyces sp. NBC_00234]|uniref:hypothetical protein n=1 Tax=Streptomyces sp. NBC_00234 TaxID=2903638 RepID=UPI002E2D6E9A|nr:hypothetical protein [Streptomyces sp. NBC_00234]
MSTIPPEVASFVAQASGLTAEVLDEIRRATAAAMATGAYDHSVVPKLSASQFSALNKQVRDAFAPRAEELSSFRPGGLRAAISRTVLTAQTVWKRETLTAGQYAALISQFAATGVPLPGRTP